MSQPAFVVRRVCSLHISRSIGAVATLFDASCFFNEIQSLSKKNSGDAVQAATNTVAAKHSIVLGHHFFVNNPTGTPGLSPTFDFRSDSERGDPTAFVITSKIGDIPAPVNPTTNVDWLELAAIPGHGDLANNVFRIFTLGGQPPKSVSRCNPRCIRIHLNMALSALLVQLQSPCLMRPTIVSFALW